RRVLHILLFISRLTTLFFFVSSASPLDLHSFPTRRSSDLSEGLAVSITTSLMLSVTSSKHQRSTLRWAPDSATRGSRARLRRPRSEEHTSELQSRENLVCRLLLEKKKTTNNRNTKPKCEAA